jgi:hypothetical protein
MRMTEHPCNGPIGDFSSRISNPSRNAGAKPGISGGRGDSRPKMTGSPVDIRRPCRLVVLSLAIAAARSFRPLVEAGLRDKARLGLCLDPSCLSACRSYPPVAAPRLKAAPRAAVVLPPLTAEVAAALRVAAPRAWPLRRCPFWTWAFLPSSSLAPRLQRAAAPCPEAAALLVRVEAAESCQAQPSRPCPYWVCPPSSLSAPVPRQEERAAEALPLLLPAEAVAPHRQEAEVRPPHPTAAVGAARPLPVAEVEPYRA